MLPSRKPLLSGPLKLLIRLLVSGAIFALILRGIDVQQVWAAVSQARWSLLAAALLLQLGSATLAAYRWQLLMQNLAFGQSFGFYWRSYFKAIFFNQGLPTSIGGDAVRVLDVARLGFRKRDALYGVALDRIVGLAALLLLNVAAHLMKPELLPPPVYHFIMLLLFLGLAGFVGVGFLRRLPWLDAYPQLTLLRAVSVRLQQALRVNRTRLIVASLAIHGLAVLGFYATGLALGLRYDLVTYLAIVPPAILLTVLPVSLAGWGVREGALVALFALVGANPATVLAMSILYGLTLIVISLPGLVIYLRGHQRLALFSEPDIRDDDV